MDTDVFSYLRTQRGRHAEFADLIGGHVLAVSFATYGEALAGGYKTKLGRRRMDELRRALNGFVVLPYSRCRGLGTVARQTLRALARWGRQRSVDSSLRTGSITAAAGGHQQPPRLPRRRF